MPRIVFDNVSKQFGQTSAVRDLSLDIADGEFLVLVGPSGCGKSTALRLLAGLERISSGDIYIGDRRVNEIAAKDRDLAMVFQSYALYPHMSVRDNIAFGLKLRKLRKAEIEDRVVEAAGLLGIQDLLDRTPRQLSGGQRQRVALGRAIVREPAAFLLDEPLSNLDAKLRVQTRAELAKLHERLGTTFIYVTHDQVEAMTMASRIAVLDRGILQQLGTPRELYERPGNLFVAGFIGSPAMNLFEATLSQPNGVPLVEAGPIQLALQEEHQVRLRGISREKLTLGVRPEHMHDPEFLPQGVDAVTVEVDVEVVEDMGSETYLHLATGDINFIARVDPRSSAAAGRPFSIAIDRSRLYFFDPETGATL